MRVLLTGATGFIGSQVLENLLLRGDSVRALVMPGTLDRLPYRERVGVAMGTIEDTGMLRQAMQDVDIVYHFSGLLPGSSAQELARVNVDGTKNLLHCTLGSGVKRFVFISSASVYESAPFRFQWPLSENFPLRTRGEDDLQRYARSKIQAENAIQEFGRAHGLAYVILRPTAVYGAGAAWFEERLKQVILSPPTPALEGRGALMQWVHRQDVGNAAVYAATRENAANQIFNIAGGELFTLQHLRDLAWSQIDSQSRSPKTPRIPSGAGHTLKYDIRKAQEGLGYTPHVKLKEVIEALLLRMDPEALTVGHAQSQELYL